LADRSQSQETGPDPDPEWTRTRTWGDTTHPHTPTLPEGVEPSESAGQPGDDPQSVGALTDEAIADLTTTKDAMAGVSALVDRCVKATGNMRWADWYQQTLWGLCQADGLGPVMAAVDYVEKCGDPVQRSLKDLGKLKNPGGYLTEAITSACKEHGVTWPDFPKGRRKA